MRISDWSSDVCSSDLGVHCHGRNVGIAPVPTRLDTERTALARQQQHACRRLRDIGNGLDHPFIEGRSSLARAADGVGKANPFVAIIVAMLEEMLGDLHLEPGTRSEEHTSELQSLMRISYAVFCLKKKTTTKRYNI